MHPFRRRARELGYLIWRRPFFSAEDSSLKGYSSSALFLGRTRRFYSLKTFQMEGQCSANISRPLKGFLEKEGNLAILGWQLRQYLCSSSSKLMGIQYVQHSFLPYFSRSLASNYSTQSPEQAKQESRKDISTVEDTFDDSPTYNIPEKPVTFVEGASYSVIILAGLGIAALAGYAVFKELILEPKEYKIFGKALARVQNDNQVTVRIGSPVTGYGHESRNRAARQRIPNRVWKDEGGVEHVEVNFYIRGPHGAGKVFAEMFKDDSEKKWKFTYLIVEITSPTRAQLMLESYVPAY
ncbi:putative mitochondrial import inner membrane translocase subunit TIM21 [Apostasia shenzhenica]|uniref:Mitochondrial import inner membrane translocase subunit Tim21 n=1 Tax=Apostasia shenzhenica TaxID=1088818 RepID=A0A2H9ZT21_9ASPA|nr:putative mitochondrial import inner membrane translocase subunit TIM21 [Apostasia shenzhenica]